MLIGCSLPKHNSYLETEGQMYVQLFDSLRLHGITDSEYIYLVGLAHWDYCTLGVLYSEIIVL